MFYTCQKHEKITSNIHTRKQKHTHKCIIIGKMIIQIHLLYTHHNLYENNDSFLYSIKKNFVCWFFPIQLRSDYEFIHIYIYVEARVNKLNSVQNVLQSIQYVCMKIFNVGRWDDAYCSKILQKSEICGLQSEEIF